jgi:hypothetical protein
MTTTNARLIVLSLFPVAALLMAACAADGADIADTADPAAEPHPFAAPPAHILPMPGAEGFAGPGGQGNGNVHMVYRGGPVISNVKVFTVFWNASVPNQSALDAFYGTIVNSSYVDWLTEYDTPTQNIGRGTFIGTYVDGAAPADTDLSDDQVRQELGRLIDAGSLPTPDANTLFMVHFPAGVSITMNGNITSCRQFCAYHSSFTHGSYAVYYGIMPDFSGGCASCGGENNQLDSTTVVSSHEVAEAMTDPNIGVANQNQDESQLGWYDDANSEIGDMCEGQSATVAGYRVTKLWSNQHNACYVTTGDSPSPVSASCSHQVCRPGAALSQSCGSCTQQICAAAPHCCTGSWDASCVAKVGAACGRRCQ